VFIVAAVATTMPFAIAQAVGGQSAFEDNWVAVLGSTTGLVALLASLPAFLSAAAARIRRERWTLLWLPLCAFPACALFLVLGKAFWWE
jgi:hypothetical protein